MLHGWGVTEYGGEAANWEEAGWTNGLPGAQDTVYLLNGAKVTLRGNETAQVHGLRIGDRVVQLPTLQMSGARLETEFIIVGDGVDSNGSFIQMGGILRVNNTELMDFEFGNPANDPTEPSHSLATFAAGEAELGDLRFNLRQNRRSRLSFFGILHQVSADSILFDTAGKADWQVAEINYVLSDAGIAPLRVRGKADLGAGDRVSVMVDGSKYEGGPATFVLLEAGELTGKPHEIQIEGLKQKAVVEKKDNRLLLIIR